MPFLMQPLILPFLYHKSATMCQIDPIKVSSAKLKPDLYNCVKTEITESTAPPQQPRKRGTIILGQPTVWGSMGLHLQKANKIQSKE